MKDETMAKTVKTEIFEITTEGSTGATYHEIKLYDDEDAIQITDGDATIYLNTYNWPEIKKAVDYFLGM